MNKSSSANTHAIIIQINDSGTITFNGKLVDIERLPARIETFLSKHATNSVIVIPNYETRHENVVRVIDKIKAFSELTVSIGKFKN